MLKTETATATYKHAPNEDEVFEGLLVMIDKKFKRTNRKKKIDPIRLKLALTAWSITKHFYECNPADIALTLRKLQEQGRITTTWKGDSAQEHYGSVDFELYFIPVCELPAQSANT